METGGNSASLHAGRAAAQRADWEAARQHLTLALTAGETPEAHVALGQALWFLNELEASLRHYRRAYALYRARGDLIAARLASWIAIEHAGVHGDISVARGWLARAARLLEGHPPSPHHGWYLMTRAAMEGDPAAVEEAARSTVELGQRFADTDLEIWALIQLGQAAVFLGRVSEGMPLVEEAMAAVLAGELSDPTVVADCFCFMLATCEYAGDYDLAEQWVRTATGYTEQQTPPFVAAQCRTTYAGVLIARGRWVEAEQELISALRLYEAGHRGLRGNVVARLADLRVGQGALEEAEDLLAGMEDAPAAVLPLARMHLSRGDATAAVALLDGALPPGDLLLADAERAEVAIEAHLAAGSIGRAEDLVTRLAALASRSGSRVLRAGAKLCEARVAAASDADRAAAALREAGTICPYPDSPLAARIRFEQAKLSARTDPAAAVVQARAALAGFRRLDARREMDEVLQLLRSLGSPTRLYSAPAAGAAALTRREREVLALAGEGLSNPQIAARLYLSPKTVEHHIGHIFAKLGVSNRAALAAYVARHGAKLGESPDV